MMESVARTEPRGPSETAVVIVHYGPPGETVSCVESIRRLHPTLPVVVVDNHSPEPLPDSFSERHSGVNAVRVARNLGFAGGANLGVQIVPRGTTAVLLLNPDVRLSVGALERMTETLKSQPNTSVVAPMLVGTDGERQDSVRALPSAMAIVCRRTPLSRTRWGRRVVHSYLRPPLPNDAPSEVDWALGACLLVRRNAGDAVGWFDTRFFLYFEDVDFCIRIRRNGGAVLWEPRAIGTHRHVRASRGSLPLRRAQRTHVASGLRFFRKYPQLVLRSGT